MRNDDCSKKSSAYTMHPLKPRHASGLDQVAEIDVEDKYTQIIEASGCKDQNDTLLECYYEAKDWRPCQAQLQAFKICMAEQAKKKYIQ